MVGTLAIYDEMFKIIIVIIGRYDLKICRLNIISLLVEAVSGCGDRRREVLLDIIGSKTWTSMKKVVLDGFYER